MSKKKKLIYNVFPFLEWSSKVSKTNIKSDIIAAITGAFVVLPQGVAFAAIAGMPPQYGLFTAMVPAVVAALWGSSKHLVSGPTTAASIMLAAFLSTLAQPESSDYIILALTITFMVGVVQLFMGILKLGALVNFIGHSVIVGFTAGAGIIIGFKQVKNYFDLPIPRDSYPHEILMYFFNHTHEVNLYAAIVATVTLLSGIIFKKWITKIPYMIAAMVIGSVTGILLNNIFGAGVTQIQTIGKLTQAIPPISSPDFTFETFKTLAPAVLAITFLALTEAVAIAKSIALKSGQNLDGNQEFIAQGLSNITGSFFSAYVATGSFNRSSVNFEAGAKTPLAAALSAIFLIIILLFIAPLAAYLPVPSVAAILLLVAYGIIDFHHIKLISKSSRGEAFVLFLTFFSTLILHLDTAIIIGVIASLLYYLLNTSRPHISVRVPNSKDLRRKFIELDNDHLDECPQVKFVRIDGSIFFGALGFIEETFEDFEENNEQKTLCLFSQSINFLDTSGAEFLIKISKLKKSQGGNLYFYKTKENFRKMIESIDEENIISHKNFYDSKGELINKVISNLDTDICRHCEKRIFNECDKLHQPKTKA